MTTPNALVPVTNYALMKTDFEAVKEAIRENLGGATINPFDLDRVKVPAAGGTTWEVPTLDGIEEVKTLTGVLIFFSDPKAYWRVPFDESGGGSPPDCTSEDGLYGNGDPGGECAKCPLNQFGSGAKGKGKACTDMRLLFMIRENNLLPLVISAPVMSIKPMKQYNLRLASNGVAYYGVQTSLSLEKAKNADNITYSKIVPAMAGRLTPEQAAFFKQYQEAIKPALQKVTIIQGDTQG